jgi:hypothetical protein
MKNKEFNMAEIIQHLGSDPELDTSIDLTENFLNIYIRCLEKNVMIARSISLEELSRVRFCQTAHIINEIEVMKSQLHYNKSHIS